MADEWLSIVEYARYYNVSDMTVRRRIKTGKLRAVLREGKYYVPLKEGHYEAFSDREDDPMEHHVPEVDVRPHSAPQQRQNWPREGHSHPQHRPRPQGHHFKPQFNNNLATASVATGTIPSTIREPLIKQGAVTMDSKALLSFCETMIDQLNKTEKRLEDGFKSKCDALESKAKGLEAQLDAKESKVNELKQQVEDLQLLVKIIEKQRPSL